MLASVLNRDDKKQITIFHIPDQSPPANLIPFVHLPSYLCQAIVNDAKTVLRMLNSGCCS